MGSPYRGWGRDAPGEHTANRADHRFVPPDLDGQLGKPAPARFEARRADHPLGVALVLRGELDLASVSLLQEQLDRAIRSGATVVIDLAGLEFLDSTGLETLLRADRRLRACEGQLVLVGGSRPVHRVFELAGADSYFTWSNARGAQTRLSLTANAEEG